MGLSRLFLLRFITCLVLFSMKFDTHEATQFFVGGKENSWRAPTSPNMLNEWAKRERFMVGDELVFKYDSKTDSVLEVEEGDYNTCNTTKPIKEHHDGNTTINMVQPGEFFFISGAIGHCDKGKKLEVKVSPAPSLANSKFAFWPWYYITSTQPLIPDDSDNEGSLDSGAVGTNAMVFGVPIMVMAIGFICFMNFVFKL
ncbi:hypothetical protein M8C21_001040 [Ambrosia artemisiifolia]|uniref:Phytocyanin domain-containing protein n=1 Tax=Ambrosia artemisiifolia TaxID=4212 RepID=A0AAD5BS16_AMBAR|nr:hypothetical protein M8C21_001040 [Ambrosia artemisiifolia]